MGRPILCLAEEIIFSSINVGSDGMWKKLIVCPWEARGMGIMGRGGGV